MNITIKTTKEKEIIDITEEIAGLIKKQEKGNGLIYLFTLHTTCSLAIADLDPGFEKDYINAFESIKPKTTFIHPHNPEHFPDHFLSSLVGNFLLLPFENKKLVLGTWQRIVLIEFNGPREREIYVRFLELDEK